MDNAPGINSQIPAPVRATRGSAGAIVMLVLGSLVAMIGVAAIIGGSVLGWTNSQQQDDGYIDSPTGSFSADSYALTTPPLNVVADQDMLAGASFNVGRIRLQATSTTPGGQVFIGIGTQADVDRYLANVHSSEVTKVDSAPFRVRYRDVPGTATPTPPAAQGFWAVSASGSGTQEIVTDLRSGHWAVVVMNADASSGVSVDLRAGFHSDLIGPLAIGLIIGGIVFLLIGTALIVAGATGLGRRLQPLPNGTRTWSSAGTVNSIGTAGLTSPGPSGGNNAVSAKEGPPYPARLSGHLDPRLSRGLWLVKWFLAIPHFIILFFLWFAFAVSTIIAGFAILFTGRYPRSLFNFNVGVLRWNWRVAFYAYSALATDQYPPFTLAQTNYPADFEVDYPLRLSRGLVLVKWWLLAIPHLLIVAVFSSTAWFWWGHTGDWVSGQDTRAGLSLLAILVLIAAVMLLFTGHYQRTLFDLIMGVNRWIFRVIAYTALMRDEYPPFRLDQGGTDPGQGGQTRDRLLPPDTSPTRISDAPGNGVERGLQRGGEE